MLNLLNKIVLTLSRPLLSPLSLADTYLLSSTNISPFHTDTKLNATGNPSQIIYQSQTAPTKGPSASLLSSTSAPSAIATTHPPVF